MCIPPPSQVSKEAGSDLLCLPEPGRDERRGRAAVQLPAHPEEAHSERGLRGEPGSEERGLINPFVSLLYPAKPLNHLINHPPPFPLEKSWDRCHGIKRNVSTARPLNQETKSNLANKIRM